MVQRIVNMFADLLAQTTYSPGNGGQMPQIEFEERILAAKKEFMQTEF